MPAAIQIDQLVMLLLLLGHVLDHAWDRGGLLRELPLTESNRVAGL